VIIKYYIIIFLEAPRITLPQKTVLANGGDKAELKCQAEGIPPPNITWHKRDIKVI